MCSFTLLDIVSNTSTHSKSKHLCSDREHNAPQVWIQGAPGAQVLTLMLGFEAPKLSIFWALFNFSIICFASLCLAYYFFDMLLFHSSNSKIFQPCFTQHMISHLQVFGFSLSFAHFRLLGVHLSFSSYDFLATTSHKPRLVGIVFYSH